jgi:hypothetical protein
MTDIMKKTPNQTSDQTPDQSPDSNIRTLKSTSLQDLCEIEKNYDQMKRFIEKSDKLELKKMVDGILESDMISGSAEATQEMVNLLMLRLCGKIKSMERECQEYFIESELIHGSETIRGSELIRGSETINGSEEYDDMIHNYVEKIGTDGEDESKERKLVGLIFNRKQMRHEILKYELTNYPYSSTCKKNMRNRYVFTDNNMYCAELIRDQIDKFNPLVGEYLEDTTWTINYKSTPCFQVPKNKILITNTTSLENKRNKKLTEHLDLLVEYLKRTFDQTSVRFKICEDNKFEIVWLLIAVGYYLEV